MSNILDESSFDSSVKGFKDYGYERKYRLKYPLPLVRFRILDEKLKLFGLSDITLPINEFENLKIHCKTVFVVENKITTLSFPKVENAIVIFGSGYSAGVLKNVLWLKDKNMYYWGDIDRDGFAILSLFRGYFTQVKSLMMDTITIKLFQKLAVEDKKEARYPESLQNLTEDEQKVYKVVKNSAFRLEQERLEYNYVEQLIISL